MNPRLHVLMFAVLDGEATPEEARELELKLSESATARDEYASMRLLFERLGSIPQLEAPGIAEAAVKQRRRNAPPSGRSPRSGFSNRGKERSMNPNRSRRSIWIGGGVAVAAVVAVAFFTIGYPPDGRNSAGTVAPAQRYRAEQPKAGDVKLGDQSVAQLMQTEAFDRFVKNPSTRALAGDPDFQALARSHADGLVALGLHPDAIAVLAQQANAQLANSQQAQARAQLANAQQANAQLANSQQAQARAQLANAQQVNAQLANSQQAQARAQLANAQQPNAQLVNAQKADAFSAFGAEANALQSLALAPQTAQVMARHNDALVAAARSQTFATLLSNSRFADALAANALANATAVNGTSTNAQQQK